MSWLNWLRLAQRKRTPTRLVCMRLADMFNVHPQQDNSRLCALCQAPVGIYPTGQAQIRRDPSIEIVCSRCALADIRPTDVNAMAGDVEAIIQEMRDSHRANP
jgi:hypothetical protein